MIMVGLVVILERITTPWLAHQHKAA
jgi:hypothetical protein